MDKQVLEEMVSLNYSQRKIAEELECSQTNIKHWLKKYDLKTNKTVSYKHIKVKEGEKYCPKCDTVKLKTDFYSKHQKGRELQHQCKTCHNNARIEWGRKTKIKMIEYKGGKCEHHLNNFGVELIANEINPCVFDFHHLNKEEKDIDFVNVKYWKWDRIKKELDKCILLCGNCHRIEHNKLDCNSEAAVLS